MGTMTSAWTLHLVYLHLGVWTLPVVGGAVYYFAADSEFIIQALESDGRPDLIASFDFETEHWSTIPVPLLVDGNNGNHVNVNDVDAQLDVYIAMWRQSALAELRGYLVLAHNNVRYSSSLDLWFLKNIENRRLWVKEYSIQDPGPAIPVYQRTVTPLLLLDDGRIVFFVGYEGTLLLYDPMTKLFSQMGKGVCQVALYTGSLLAECLGIQSMVAGV
ncbi:hypothetical protein HU200_036012 [Digitaria exilis]|uniref:F-box associated domain-containing protein n=1 Tax=Digitaria exilis TaxID=1010633 RepID=A0A835BMI4_9POAL|nr:hypothetical protein HU200_036012 [Digitaria exilis]